MRNLLWAALLWLAILPLAVVNGIFREAVLLPQFGTRVAQPISGLLLMGLITVVAWILVGRLGRQPPSRFVIVGIGWGLATVAFETAMVLATDRAWDRVWRQYSFADNNLWPLVMVWLVVIPALMARWRFEVGGRERDAG